MDTATMAERVETITAPKPTVSPAIFKILSEKLYSGNQLVILARELLQNAWDAQRANGSVEKIQIRVNITKSERFNIKKYTISCSDTGIGMDRYTLAHHFFCAGSSGKSNGRGGETGGFGIAAINILSKPSFWVRSHDYFYTSKMMNNGGELATVPEIVGTQVGVSVETQTWHGGVDNMLRVCLLSDAPVEITIVDEYDGKVVYSKGVGNLSEKSISNDFFTSRTSYDLSGFNNTEIEPDEYENVCRMENLPERVELSGKMAIRMNGLVQFIKNLGGKQCYYLDVETDINPQDSDYIFSISRESISDDEFQDWVSEFANSVAIDPISNNRSFNENHNVEDVGFSGETRIGMRDKSELRNIVVGEWSDYKTRAQGFARYQRERLRQIGSVKDKYILDRSYVEDFGDRVAEDWHWKLLELWRYLLMAVVVENDENFFVGLTTSSPAARSGDACYLINPSSIEKCEGKDGIIYYMWSMAVHEYAHRYHDYHDENHSSAVITTCQETADLLHAHMGTLKRKLVKSIMINTDNQLLFM